MSQAKTLGGSQRPSIWLKASHRNVVRLELRAEETQTVEKLHERKKWKAKKSDYIFCLISCLSSLTLESTETMVCCLITGYQNGKLKEHCSASQYQFPLTFIYLLQTLLSGNFHRTFERRKFKETLTKSRMLMQNYVVVKDECMFIEHWSGYLTTEIRSVSAFPLSCTF